MALDVTGTSEGIRTAATWLREFGEILFVSILALGLLLLLPVLVAYFRVRPEAVPEQLPVGFQH